MVKNINKRAFTLIELLVVISIIALLVSILMPSLNQARERARRLLCASNQRQIGLSLHMYSGTNNDKLPMNMRGVWLWDIAYSTADYIIKTGGDRKTFYCPSDKTKTPEMSHRWQYTQFEASHMAPSTRDLSEEGVDKLLNHRVTGYFWLIDTYQGRVESIKLRKDEKGNTIESPKHWLRKMIVKFPDSVELVTDATISEEYKKGFDCVKGGGWTLWQNLDRTNHMKGDEPQGGNILYVDGHVSWRDYSEMTVRYQMPYHYW